MKTQRGKKSDSSVTDNTGAYKFYNISNGTYKLVCGKTTMKWGGCSPADALQVNRYFVGLTKTIGDALRAKAADVNNIGKVTPPDALSINKRFVGLIKKFNIPDWLYESPTIIVNDANVTQNIKAICSGDVNVSYPN